MNEKSVCVCVDYEKREGQRTTTSLSLSLCRFFNQWFGGGGGWDSRDRESLCEKRKKKKKVRIEGREGQASDANSAFNKVSHGCHLNTVAYSLFSSRFAIIEEENESRE